MHTGPMPEDTGKFTGTVDTDRKCSVCGKPMTCQVWESNDGAYEDEKLTCPDGHVLWIGRSDRYGH